MPTPTPPGPPPQKPGRAGLIAFVALTLLLGAGVGAVLWRKGEQRKAQETSNKQLTPGHERDATQPITNEDYRFRLDVPGEGWKLLNEEESLLINPDALAGGVYLSAKGGFMWLAVFCEKRGADDDLALYTKRLARYVNLSADGIEPRMTKHHGREAAEITTVSEFGGQQVWLGGRAFRHGAAHICSAVTFGFPPKELVKRQSRKALDALVPLEGTITDRPRLPPPDDQGVGWRRRKGVYEDAATGLRLAPPEGCRVMGGLEAHGDKSQSRAVYSCRQPDFSVAFNQWRDDGEDEKLWPDTLAEAAVDGYESTGETLQAHAEGRDVKLYVAKDAVEGDEVLGAGWSLGRGRYAQLVVYYSPSLRKEVLPRLPEVFKTMRLMPEDERRPLAKQLAALSPPAHTVVDQHYHDRTYFDFQTGMKWTHNRGPWMVRVGHNARSTWEKARMWAHHPGLDIELVVQADSDPGPAYHQQALAALKDDTYGPAVAQPSRKWGDVDVTMSKLPASDVGRTHLYVGTAVIDGVGQTVTLSVAENLPSADNDVAMATLDAITFVRPVPPKEIQVGAVFKDHVAGVQLEIPAGLPRQKSQRLDGGVQYVWSDGARTLGFVVSSLGEGNSGFLRNVLVHSITGLVAQMTKAPAEYKKTTVAGQSAEHIHFEGRPYDVEVWHFMVDGQLYVIFSYLPDEQSKAVRNSLTRL